MFRTRSRPLAFAVVLIGGLAAGSALAFGPGPGPGPLPPLLHGLGGERLEEAAAELGISEAQVTEIQAIADDAREQGEALRAEHEGLRAEGLALFAAETIDRKAVEKHRQAMLDAADEGTALFVDTMVRIAEVLTPEQRAAVAAKVEQFHADGGWRARVREHVRGHLDATE